MFRSLHWLVAWTVIANAWLPLWANGNAPQSILQVRVYNLARIGSKDLAGAKREAAAIFGQGGITTIWKDGIIRDDQPLAMDFSANDSRFGACPANEAAEVNLQFIRTEPRDTLPDALGFALPCARFGVTVTVFVERCEEAMYHRLASLPKILGHVMAHEIGHVLLGSNSHADAGIMRNRWTNVDWWMVAGGHMAFLPWQLERIKDRLSTPRQTSETAAPHPETAIVAELHVPNDG